MILHAANTTANSSIPLLRIPTFGFAQNFSCLAENNCSPKRERQMQNSFHLAVSQKLF